MPRFLALATALLVGCPSPETETDTDVEDTDTDSPMLPGTETVSVSWDVDLFSQYQSPKIPRFDTLDGTRKLDGMIIAVDHAAAMTVTVENGGDVALEAADYAHEYYLQSIIQLGIEEEPPPEGEEGPPFFGPGAFIAVQEVALAAADDTEGSGPDYSESTVTDDIQFEAHYDRIETARYLDAMTGEEEIQLVVGGFSESWVYWTDDEEGGLLYAGAKAVQYSGTMTVTYEYSPVAE